MKNIKKKTAFIIASFFGAGFFPKMPGSMGSLCALPFIWICTSIGGWYGLLFFAVATFVIGFIASVEVLKYTKHDPGLIVIDEVSGQTVTFMLSTPFLTLPFAQVWWIYLCGFVLFRVFDILKPWPVSWADTKLISALGVMLDDILAGFYAAICLYFVLYLI